MMKTLELICRACGHREICRPTQMLRRLRSLGMLRRVANPEPDVLSELFNSSLPKFSCANCGHMGLSSVEYVEDEWEEDRLCEVCGKQISAARLAALPGVTRCVDCANGAR